MKIFLIVILIVTVIADQSYFVYNRDSTTYYINPSVPTFNVTDSHSPGMELQLILGAFQEVNPNGLIVQELNLTGIKYFVTNTTDYVTYSTISKEYSFDWNFITAEGSQLILLSFVLYRWNFISTANHLEIYFNYGYYYNGVDFGQYMKWAFNSATGKKIIQTPASDWKCIIGYHSIIETGAKKYNGFFNQTLFVDQFIIPFNSQLYDGTSFIDPINLSINPQYYPTSDPNSSSASVLGASKELAIWAIVLIVIASVIAFLIIAWLCGFFCCWLCH